MVLQLVIAVIVAIAAVVTAAIIRRRTKVDPPTQPTYDVPAQLDRADFERPEAPWLVVAFSSATCLSCQDAWEKARHLESADVAVQEVEAIERKDLHEKYGIDAVPMILVVDAHGVTQTSFLGVPSAADLWAALAALRA